MIKFIENNIKISLFKIWNAHLELIIFAPYVTSVHPDVDFTARACIPLRGASIETRPPAHRAYAPASGS
jgi:hypothetical protein